MLIADKASRAILLFWMVYIYSLQDSGRIVVEETAIRNSIERATFASKDFLLQKSGSKNSLHDNWNNFVTSTFSLFIIKI